MFSYQLELTCQDCGKKEIISSECRDKLERLTSLRGLIFEKLPAWKGSDLCPACQCNYAQG